MVCCFLILQSFIQIAFTWVAGGKTCNYSHLWIILPFKENHNSYIPLLCLEIMKWKNILNNSPARGVVAGCSPPVRHLHGVQAPEHLPISIRLSLLKKKLIQQLLGQEQSDLLFYKSRNTFGWTPQEKQLPHILYYFMIPYNPPHLPASPLAGWSPSHHIPIYTNF